MIYDRINHISCITLSFHGKELAWNDFNASQGTQGESGPEWAPWKERGEMGDSKRFK